MSGSDHQENKPRALIADDQAVVAAGIRKLIEPECEVVGIVDDGRTLLVEAEKLRPDLIIMEITLLLLNGVDAAPHLTKAIPGSKIIFLTGQTSSAYVAAAFKAGASAYVLKRSPPSELSQAIQAVRKGQCYLTPLITKDVLANGENGSKLEAGRATVASLTPRQREVLQLIAEGRGTKEVATLLSIAVKTVEFHKFRIMDQLNLHSTVALAKRAIAEGLVGP
ncbi:MAG: response regulator transcription factor [Nitrospirota bacterium]